MAGNIGALSAEEIRQIAHNAAARMIVEHGEEGARFMYKSGKMGHALARFTWLEICKALENQT